MLAVNYDGLIATATPPLNGGGAELSISLDGRTIAVNDAATRDSSLWHLGESGFARVSLSGMEPLYIFLPGAFNDFEGRDTISLMVDAKRGVALIDTATGRLNRWVPGWDVSKGAYGEVFETQALYVLASEEGLIEIRSLVDDSILHRFTELQTAFRESKNKPLYFGGTVAQFNPSFRTLLGNISEPTSSTDGISRPAKPIDFRT